MSSASSAVTYTSVYIDSEQGRVFWGADEELSDGGSPRVIVYGYNGLPMMPVAPPSPDYILGPEEPQTPPAPQDEDEHEHMFIQPHDPDFMTEPIYLEYIPLEDEHILPAEEQPLPPVVSPTVESPGYIVESDPEEDHKEYEEDETGDGPVDYPKDGVDDGDDDDGNSSGYDVDDEDEEEEEEEHLAPADSAVVIPIDELTSISLPPEAEVERLLAMPTPPPSPLTLLSTPSTGEHLARCTAPAIFPSPPLPPSLYPPPPVDRRDDYGFADTVEAEMRHRGIGEVGYGIRDTWIDLAEAVPEMAPTTLEKVNTRVTELAELHEHDTQDLYALLEDAQDVTRQGQNPPPPNTNTPPHHMTLESVQAMIDQALLRNSTNGDGSVVGLTRWIKKMESVFNSSGCAIENQGELKKLEIELWNLKVKGNDIPTYTNRFQELTLICTKFVANENEKIDKYIGGLPDNIYGNVKSSKHRTLDETIELTNDLMDQKLRTYAKRANNKRKTDDTSRNNHRHQQQPFKKQNVAKTGADRSFISTAFSSLVNIDLTPLGSSYDVELADGKMVGIYTIIRGCTINFQNHPFNIDLMPVELGSFDVIIGMDWLRRCHAVIVCDDKLVQIPYGNETLTFCGNESNNGRESRLAVISCSKAQKYMVKGCQIFLAQISAKKEGDKSEVKQLKDVPIVRDFLEVFPEDFLGIPLARPVEFQIDLIPRAAPVARAPYRLAPFEM
nr:reverse transcriptase domain-containing protein [Tanacetum cinerariifolium]